MVGPTRFRRVWFRLTSQKVPGSSTVGLPYHPTSSRSSPFTSSSPVDTPSRAEFSGVMVIDSITPAAGKSKTLYISGGFCHGGPVMGVFRYYNGPDYVFEQDSRWFVHATVSQYHIFRFSASETDCRLPCLTGKVFPGGVQG